MYPERNMSRVGWPEYGILNWGPVLFKSRILFLYSTNIFFFDRKRRKQTHVPVESKDDKYWARRMKNNEAAKRSRDMRIKREKVVFEENSRLEQDNREMRTELVR